MYIFTYQITEEDYFAFNLYHMEHAPVHRMTRLVTRFGFPLLLLLFALLPAERGTFWSSFIASLIVAVLWVVFYEQVLRYFIKRSIAKTKKSGKLPFAKENTLRFENDYFAWHSELGEGKTFYSVMEKIATGHNAYYIYTSAVQAYILPFKAFTSPQQQAEFLAFLQAKLQVK